MSAENNTTKKETVDYKSTVFLPKTDFPMKANLAVREVDILKRWQEMDLYKTLREQSKGRKKFILHFGPPYANGNIHIGHALTESLKDVLNKIKQMQGFDAPMVPGWDCHGLPIEWQIEKNYQASGKNKDDVPALEFRKECRTFADKWINIQREEFKRLGIVADWDNPYSTMDFKSEAAIVREIGKLHTKGLIYRGLKPVLWSVIEKTALAEAETEYKDHTSDAIFVGFPIVKSDVAELVGAHAVIWTTTPWSLPGNRAIAYGDFDYILINIDESERQELQGRRFLIAEALLEQTCQTLGIKAYTQLKKIKGQTLNSTIAHHPLRDLGYTFDVPFFYGDHVTTDTGTGLVHTAPSHGMEDFILGQKHGLPVPNTLSDDGIYTNEVPYFQGTHVFKANPPILEKLTEAHCLIHHSKLVHSYPHSWRSKAPLIYRAATQWFIDVEKMRATALEAVKNTRFVPEQGRHRMQAMVANRPDWGISRQRAWGTPLTLFVHKETGEVLKDPEVHARIVEKVAEQGVDAWFSVPAQEFLGSKYNANDYEQVQDVIDVWLDSGCTHSFVLQEREELSWPADVYFEGSDQHRGWFQSSLWHGVATMGRAPYNQVITHGFVLDEKGYKMSKSQGTGLAPEDIIKTYGADILRLWVTSVDYSDDVRIGKEILKHLEDIYRRFRNTLRYLLGALDNFQDTEKLSYEELPELEKYILHKLYGVDQELKKCSEDYDFAAFYNTLHTFCAVDLSAFYFDIRKDSLYCDDANNLKRRATRTLMDILFNAITRYLAPVLSFTAEEAYQCRFPNAKDSIHMQAFLVFPGEYENISLAEKWEKIRTYRRVMTGALEVERAAKTIGSSLQGELQIYTSKDIIDLFKDIDIAEFAITSKATLVMAQPVASAFMLDDVPDMGVVVSKAEGEKCERCWRVLEEVKAPKHLCQRCDDVVERKS